MSFKDIVNKIFEDVNKYVTCMQCGREIHEEDAIVVGFTGPGMKTKQCICTNCATYMMSVDPGHLVGVEESQTGDELTDLFLDWCTINGEICNVANFDRYIKTIEDAEPHPDDILYAREGVSKLAKSISRYFAHQYQKTHKDKPNVEKDKEGKVREMSSFSHCSTCDDTTPHIDTDGRLICTRCNHSEDTSVVNGVNEKDNPSCPKCKHYNAMLSTGKLVGGKIETKCRDCGYINMEDTSVVNDNAKPVENLTTKEIDKTQVKINELRCPKCKHQFTTQCRCGSVTSKDGLSVKYECEKCRHEFTKKYDKPVWKL